MDDTSENNNEMQPKIPLKKRVIEGFLTATARHMRNQKERLEQKKEKIIQAVPVLRKMDEKWHAFDSRMEAEHGQVYTKIRDSAKNITRTVLAAKMFGIPGVVGMCAYKTCEKSFSILEPALKAKENGETSSILDYLHNNPEEARFTGTSGAISICSATCDVVGAPAVKAAVRVGKATWLVAPEAKQLVKTTGKWLAGEEPFVEVKRDAAVMGITFGTYFVSGVPMTHGSGKPQPTEESEKIRQEKALKPDPLEPVLRDVLTKSMDMHRFLHQDIKKIDLKKMNPFDRKMKKEGR